MAIRNPNWTRDELILALDLYFRADKKWLDEKSQDVIELSETLNKLPFHSGDERNARFRNPPGVSMKLGNFLRLDPDYPGKGLDQGSKLDEEVWEFFSYDPSKLAQTADSIRKIIEQSDTTEDKVTLLDLDAEEFPEGRTLTRVHQTRERNAKPVQRKKQKVLDATGHLACDVCGFDFAETYGDLGYGFAECHHTVPIFQLGESHQTRLDDLAIVCPNCHRMIHRIHPMPTIAELRKLVVIRLERPTALGV